MAENVATWNNFLEHATLSDVGLRRSNNQDSFCVALAGDERNWRSADTSSWWPTAWAPMPPASLPASWLATACRTPTTSCSIAAPPDALRQAIVETNARIHGRGEANAEFHGMGTTCSVLAILPQGALIGHVGDSRAYRLRNARLEQLTFDHSLVWEMMASGQLPAGNPGNFVPKNIITRSLGPHAEVKVDLEGPFPLEVGDTFLLCSDGLSGQVRDDQIGVILGSMAPQEAARALVDLANLNGGPDNITVIVVRVARPLDRVADDRGFRPPAAAGKGFSFHPAIWVTIGVAPLITIGLAVNGNFIAAALSSAVAIAAAVVGLVQAYGRGAADSPAAVGPFGKGPHTASDCRPTRESVRDLAGYAKKLREAATDQRWNVDWGRFNSLLQASETAEAAGQFGAASRQMALAISFMMEQIRHQRPKPQSRDSSVVDL